ncbi:MAG: hypothetical protein Fur0032_04270 [Terrimicrobiaceae bacterium]
MDQPNQTYVQSNLFDQGIGEIVVARRKGADSIEFGVFLLDTFCLGVKDATFARAGTDEFHQTILPKIFEDTPYEVHDGAWGRKLIEDAIAYAADLGISPHPDYKKGARVFGGIRASDCKETFTFGKNGKPFYIQGSFHSHATAMRIIHLLRARLGDGGFDYLLGADGFYGADDIGDEEDEMVILVSDTHPDSVGARSEYKRILDRLKQGSPSEYENARLILDADGVMVSGLLKMIRENATDKIANLQNSYADHLRYCVETFRFLTNLRLLPPDARKAVVEEFEKMGGPRAELENVTAEMEKIPAEEQFPFIYHCEILDTDDPAEPRLILFCEMPSEG